eukprot:12930339-Prorocentrum_lima.AAC.1
MSLFGAGMERARQQRAKRKLPPPSAPASSAANPSIGKTVKALRTSVRSLHRAGLDPLASLLESELVKRRREAG